MSSSSKDEDNGLNTPLGKEVLLLKLFPDIFKTVNLVRPVNDAESNVFSKLLLTSRYVRFSKRLKRPGFIVLIKLFDKIKRVVETEMFIEADESSRFEQFVQVSSLEFVLNLQSNSGFTNLL